jgi:uncharacterized protein
MEYLGYFFSIVIGVILGLIGSGGSILTIPVLVYLFGINPEKATSYSLFIVGLTSIIGTIRNFRLGNIKLKIALNFVVPSIVMLLFVRNLILPTIPKTLFWINNFQLTKDKFLLFLFATLMILASLSLLINKKKSENETSIKTKKVILLGLLIGFVTGLLGAGGGFLIIPSLLYFGNLTMKQAVGTSLFIIAINSTIGFFGDIVNGVKLSFKFLFLITSLSVFGIILGTWMSNKIDGKKLKPIFGWFVLVVAIYIISSELFTK